MKYLLALLLCACTTVDQGQVIRTSRAAFAALIEQVPDVAVAQRSIPLASAVPLGRAVFGSPRFLSYTGEPVIGQWWNVFFGDTHNRYTSLGLLLATSGRQLGDAPLYPGVWIDPEGAVLIMTEPGADYALLNDVFGLFRRSFFNEEGRHIQDGYMNFLLRIPNDPALIGVSLWLQGFSLDPLLLSEGLLLRFGLL